jgi:hypothetical protein
MYRGLLPWRCGVFGTYRGRGVAVSIGGGVCRDQARGVKHPKALLSPSMRAPADPVTILFLGG